jgi:tetratricopeptide (TPR) repeat protein
VTKLAPEISWKQAERNSLLDFADDRARDFVGRQPAIARLTSLCFSPAQDGAPWGVCVTGEPGSGKSALFGELLHRMKDTDAFVLAHAADASPRASSVDAMLRRWIDELGSALGVGDVGFAENVYPETVETAFASLLGRMASQRRVVLLIDALGEFKKTTCGRFTNWLPRLWPANARLVATAIAGGASKALAERPGMEALSLPPLDATEARDIIEGICDRYHRKFEPPVIDALLTKRHAGLPAWGSPLWLVLAVEELNLLEAHDFACMQREYTDASAERLQSLMLDVVGVMPTDIFRLYRATFDRAAELLGTAVVAALIGLIAASRAGWRESDFRQLLPRVSGEPWNEVRFAALRRVFRGQMRQRGDLAQWDFNHAQMRAAARSRLAALRLSKPQLHLAIADHLLTLPSDDPLRITETMVHLLASNNDVRAAQYCGDSSLSEAEVHGATRALADTVIAPPAGTPANAARDICRLLDTPDSSVCALVANRFLYNLGDAIEHHVPLEVRLIILNSTQRAFEQLLRIDPDNVGWQRDLSASYDRVGGVLVALGNLPEALKSFRDGLAIRHRLAHDNAVNASWQRDLSVSYDRVGDVLVAQGNLPEALKSFNDGLAIRDRLARDNPDNVSWQRDLSVSYDRVGDVLVAQGNLPEALKSFHEGLAIRDRLARADPDSVGWQRGLSVSYDCVGDVLVAQGNLPEALKSFRDGLAIRDRLARDNPDNVSWHRDLSVSYDRVGAVLEAQGNLPEALKCFHDAQAIADRLARADPTNADCQRALAVSYAHLADVYRRSDDPDNALAALRQGQAVMERAVKLSPDNAGWKNDLGWFNDEIAALTK